MSREIMDDTAAEAEPRRGGRARKTVERFEPAVKKGKSTLEKEIVETSSG